jgi:beta-N-acetylhexosaminidase
MTLEQILSLPVEKKIGQLFFIGISSSELDATTTELLDKISPGGICLFARNVRTSEQVRKLLEDIREISAIQPFFSLDQEGGLVDRLRRISTRMPSASAMRNAEDAKILAETTAEIIRILGFNMNFAPVVDVVDEERAEFQNGGLHSRAFGKSKEEVIEFAGNYLDVLQENGILGCLKHFPGLGGAKKDAHDELPIVGVSNQELFDNDLLPYKEFLKQKTVHAIMVAHASFPNSDLQETDQNGKLLPTSLSFNFITKLLREQLGYENLVITDDLEMGAIVNNYGIGEACKMAIKSGEDMLAICANASAVREGFYALLEAVKNEEIPEMRIDESLKRIFNVKTKINQSLPFNSARLQELSDKIAELNQQLKYSYGG